VDIHGIFYRGEGGMVCAKYVEKPQVEVN